MEIEKFRIGQKITLTRDNEKNGENYYSTIQNIKEDVIYIDLPYSGEIPLVLMHNEPITVKYVAQSAAFIFTTRCLGVHKETESLRFYILKAPVEQGIKRIQMREFVRVPMMVDVKFSFKDQQEIHKGTTVDMSAGGMRLATKKRLPENKIIDLNFNIKRKNQTIDVAVKAQVVRSELVDQQLTIYHSGLKFLEVTRKLEDMLVSFVFEKQMEQMRRR